MNILIYILIFIFMLIEEALKTLRIIIVANGKKIIGSILQFFIALIWMIITGSVIIDIKKDPLKIFFYASGSLVGSYIGSLIEEKIALGTNIYMVEVKKEKALKLKKELKLKKYKVNEVLSFKKGYEMLMITSPRKKSNDVINIIRSHDKKTNIISEKVKISYPSK